MAGVWVELPAIVAWAIIIRWRTIAAVVVRPTIIVGSCVVGTVIIPAVVGLAVGRAEVIKQERKRERDTETYPLGSGRELGENQGANREYEKQ
jgi:hypothetical protein